MRIVRVAGTVGTACGDTLERTPKGSRRMNVRIVVSGRNYDLAHSIPEELTLSERASVDDALKTLAGFLPKNRCLPGSCLLAVSGVHLGSLQQHRAQLLKDGDELLVLSPVAGG